MGCGCGVKKKTSPYLAVFVTVDCPTCTDNIEGLDGMFYPAHVANVIVTRTQFEAWQAAGIPVRIVS